MMMIRPSSAMRLRVLSAVLSPAHAARPTSGAICFQRWKHFLASRAACVPKTVSIVSVNNRTARLVSTSRTTESADLQGLSSLPDVSSHYSIFRTSLPLGPPPAGPFDIDLASLRREYLDLQSRFHPDKFPPEQRARAEALSSRINEAYRALRDPLVRAQYLLFHVYGIDVTCEDNSSHPMDSGILMEVMEVQESIEEAGTEEQIRELKEQNRERVEQTIRSLADAFSSGDAEAARRECIRLRYWASLGEGLNAWNGKGSDVRLVH